MRGARLKISIRPRYLDAVEGGGGQTYLYYRRAGQRIPLPGPEGSEAFRRAYEAAEALFGGPAPPKALPPTVDLAITEYLGSADYQTLEPATRSDYRRVLDDVRAHFGGLMMAAIDAGWVEALRDRYAARPVAWNHLRSRMVMVTALFRRRHPGILPDNPWQESRRLHVPRSRAHRPWPAAVLLAVMRAATPEFRALLTAYLMTAQRGGDVTAFSAGQYDPAARTLDLTQGKTDEPMLLHVPDSLARVFEAMRGRARDRLLCTPRGHAWDTKNAQETLRTLLRQLGLPRYTLHGLRATGPVALKMLGFENRVLRTLTGHTSDANLEVYLAGVDHHALARVAQEALEGQFQEMLAAAEDGANQRRFAGVTGRAARKKGAGE